MKRIIFFLFCGLCFTKINTYAQCEDQFGNVTFTTANTFNINGSSNVTISAAGTYLIYGNGTASARTVTVNLTSATTVANIYLCNVNIEATATATAFTITRGTVNLYLGGTNTLTSGGTSAGLQVISGTTGGILTINGPGKLTATGGSSGGAGIGGNATASHGPITIRSGEIIAIGGGGAAYPGGAGIGGGGGGTSNNTNGANGGTITISGGTVTATGGSSSATSNMGGGAGIGGGGGNRTSGGTVGTVSITGGVVTVTGGTGPSGKGAGIGAGGGNGSNGTENGSLSSASITPSGSISVLQGTSSRLTASATVTPPRVLNYQWYRNTSASNTGGTSIPGATSATYNIPTNVTGIFYYYCVISAGNFTPSSTSAVTVTVAKPNVAQEPVIADDSPANLSVFVGDKDDDEDGVVLAVEASITDGGKLTYQWYEAVDEDDEDGIPVGDETEDSYIVVPTDAAKTYYYYVVVTNTNQYVDVDENKTRSVTSGIAKVVVSKHECDIEVSVDPVEIDYSGRTIDLTAIDDLFKVPDGAGARTYTLKTGAPGSITGSILTITALGTFEITLATAESPSHEAGGPVTAKLEILPKTLTITGSFTATGRPYNGSKEVELSGDATLDVDGIIVGDNVALSTPRIGLMNDANADVNKPVLVKLSGDHSQFYTLPVPGLSVDIARKEVEIRGLIAKVFGKDDIDFDNLYLFEIVTGDDVKIDHDLVEVTYVTENYGDDNEISFTGNFGLKGDDAGNYTIKLPVTIKGRLTWAKQADLVITPGNNLEINVDVPTQLTVSGGSSNEPLEITFDDTYVNAVVAGDKINVTAKSIVESTLLNVIMPGKNQQWEPVSETVTIKVNKGTKPFPSTGPLSATYREGLTLNNVTFTNTAYKWKDPTISLSAGDNQKFTATYTDPSGNYEPVDDLVTVNVAKATIVISDDVKSIEKDVVFNNTQSQSVTILEAKVGNNNELLSGKIPNGVIPTYEAGNPVGDDIINTRSVTNGVLTFTVKQGSQAGKEAKIPVVLSFTNYLSITVNVVVKLIPETTIPVTGVTLNKDKLELEKGKEETLVATVVPANATNKNVTWKSDKEAVATVDNNGKIKAISEGKATITVTTVDGGKEAKCEVTVSDPSLVEAAKPVIDKQPVSAIVDADKTHDLTVEASVTDKGTLSYQWFTNDKNSIEGGTAIKDATDATYAAPIDKPGTYYFYVVVTNTLTVNNVEKTASTTSSVATLTVKEAPKPTGEIDVLSPNLNIYPNPFEAELRIIDAEGCTLRVVSGSGAVVHSQKITSPDETVRLEQLPVGLYFFHLEKGSQSKTIKVIKN